MLFLISEVHPFDDGNGRISRLIMNAELVAGREQRVIVPIAARGTYLAALRALTRNDNPDPLIDCLEMLQSRTHDVDWTNRSTARTSLEEVGAFEDPDIAPREWRLI